MIYIEIETTYQDGRKPTYRRHTCALKNDERFVIEQANRFARKPGVAGSRAYEISHGEFEQRNAEARARIEAYRAALSAS